MRVLVFALLCCAQAAAAEQYVYSAFAGGGVGVQVGAGAPRVLGTVLLESVLGLTDELNVEGALVFELGHSSAASIGVGAEYVLFHTNHWRFDVGAGLALRAGLPSLTAVQPAAYVMSAIRWLFAWGVGASLGVRALVPIGPQPTVVLLPSLALYQEFW